LRDQMEAVWREKFPNGRLPDSLAVKPLAIHPDFLRALAQASNASPSTGEGPAKPGTNSEAPNA
jgi:hypothetical protein